MWLVTAGAVTMQVIHAYAIGQPEAAMVYATASVLTVVLWRAKIRRSLRDRLRAAGMIEDPLPRYRPVRWCCVLVRRSAPGIWRWVKASPTRRRRWTWPAPTASTTVPRPRLGWPYAAPAAAARCRRI